jgi:hypothetical protein
MSKSPLSGAFSGSSEPAKKNKKNGAILLIAGIALTSSIGGVFAANSITLNTNNTLEFGQGAATTSACDAGIDVKVNQDLASTGTAFVVRNVVLTGINDLACSGKGLEVSLVNSSATVLTSTTFRSPGATETWTITGVSTVNAGEVNRVAITSTN